MIRSFWTTDESPGRRRRRLLATLVIAALALAIAAATPMTASAATITDTTTYTLSTANIAYPADYGTVTVDLYSDGTAVVSFSSGSSGGYNYLFSDGSSMAVNVNASSFTVSGISASGGLYSTTGWTTNINPKDPVDGYGKFNLTIDNFDGSANAFLDGSFTLTNTEVGGSWATASDVLEANTKGNTVAAHISVFSDSSYTTWPGGGDSPPTGYVGDGEGTLEIPEPASATLLAIGLVGMAGYGWRRRRQGGGSTPTLA